MTLGIADVVWSDDVAPASDRETVGRSAPNRTVTPVNQVLTPLGRQIDLPGMRPQAVALSPDGKLLVISGKTSELVIADPQTGTIRQRVKLPSDDQRSPPKAVSSHILKPDRKGQLSFTGLDLFAAGRPYLHEQCGGLDKSICGSRGRERNAFAYVAVAARQCPATRNRNP